MKSHEDVIPAAADGALKNSIWAFPYLAVMGLIWGYLWDAATGAIIGLLIAAVASAFIGPATTIFSGRPAGAGAHTRYDRVRNSAGNK